MQALKYNWKKFQIEIAKIRINTDGFSELESNWPNSVYVLYVISWGVNFKG